MVNATTNVTNTNIVTQVKGFVSPIVNIINNLLTQLIPGNEEWAIIILAVYLGWLYRNREYVSGGYDVWLKASIIIYIVLKILGLGKSLF